MVRKNILTRAWFSIHPFLRAKCHPPPVAAELKDRRAETLSRPR